MSDSRTAPLPDTPETGMALGEVAATLWREREVLEDLLYALTVENLVLTAGHPRWLARADAAVSAAAQALREHEVLRAVGVDALRRFAGDGHDVSLADLAARSPQPWPTVLVDHRIALLELTEQIETLTARNRELLQAGERATSEALDRMRTGTAAPDQAPYPVRLRSRSRTVSVLDEQA